MPEPPNHALKSSSAFVWNTGQRGTPMYTVGSTSWSLKPPVLSPTWQRTRGDWPRPLVQSRPWYYCWCPPRPRLPSWSRCRHPQCLASSPWWRFFYSVMFHRPKSAKYHHKSVYCWLYHYIILYPIRIHRFSLIIEPVPRKIAIELSGEIGVSHPPVTTVPFFWPPGRRHRVGSQNGHRPRGCSPSPAASDGWAGPLH